MTNIYYRIEATLTRHDSDGYRALLQVPAFILDANTHGLRSEHAAAQFAVKMLNAMHPHLAAGAGATIINLAHGTE